MFEVFLGCVSGCAPLSIQGVDVFLDCVLQDLGRHQGHAESHCRAAVPSQVGDVETWSTLKIAKRVIAQDQFDSLLKNRNVQVARARGIGRRVPCPY